MQGSFTVAFRLKSSVSGSSIILVSGNHPALGNNDPAKAIPLFPTTGSYNYTASVNFDQPIPEGVTYNYFFKTQFGTIVKETAPKRELPLFAADGQVYDNINESQLLTSVMVKFNVRVSTYYGQEVYLLGEIPELGGWDQKKAIPLFFEGKEDRWSTVVAIPLSDKKRVIEYKYIVSKTGAIDHYEPEENHKLELAETPSPCVIEVMDQYRWKDQVQQAFTRATFTQVVNRRESKGAVELIAPEEVKPNTIKIYFQVLCPFVRSEQSVYIVGSTSELGNWDPEAGIKLSDGKFPFWTTSFVAKKDIFPFEYKYVIKNADGSFTWEQQDNRKCNGFTLNQFDDAMPKTYFINDWYTSPNKDFWKGLGVYVPIFSLRTKDSQGIGSYTDIKKLVDVCNAMGASMIQLLPINDTTNRGEWPDSYPYKQVSCFALNAMYIDLLAILDTLPQQIYHQILNTKQQLESLKTIDYPAVFKFKMDVLGKIFDLVKDEFAKSQELDKFIAENASWLKPYALFIMFRAKYDELDFHKWPEHSTITPQEIEDLCDQHKEELLFTYWIQYIADVQFKASYKYASEHNVALKGDLPIGVDINSVECWAFPKLFRLSMCAGAPPDDFSADGQNWGFPTYNWEEMEKDGFAWWRSRLQRMAGLYHTLRVDHILGFFRIWEIPRDTCVRGLLGHFFPSNPLTSQELNNMGLWDIERYVKPYVKMHLLQRKFGANASEIAKKYFEPRGVDENDDTYDFKDEYNTEKKIQAAIKADSTIPEAQKKAIQQSLFELIGNVILIEDPERKGCYHVRTEVMREGLISTPNGPIIIPSSSWEELPWDQKNKVRDLYYDFTYKRQTDLWVRKAVPKINMLLTSTKMLICGEDLGQITEGIIKCLESSGLLSLRVQRMSKDPQYEFDEYQKFAYLSVACPSTHDTSSLRGWWEENTKVTDSFWYHTLLRHEPTPKTLSPEFQEMIIRQNIWSNSMWAIFLLQDLTGICKSLRLQTPEEERINVPSNPDQHWEYRYPYTLEDLLDNKEFITQMRGLVEASHRI